ncbi:YbaB/EbfC family nucleoid-associated protein [Kribbella sp. NPDC051620]|uniref:YbaB/EbfC family nucleoid-associated protein n=1 Tax=Kribbella sp. NPDC051620 TaxID=3364120 RepID=UPI003790943C
MDFGKPTATDPDGVLAGLDELERHARTLQQAMATERATAESADGLIQVTVDARGGVLELDLDPRIYRVQDSTALAADILLAIKKATAAAQGKVFRQAKSLFGAGAFGAGTTAEDADLEFDAFLREVGRLKGDDRG